MLSFPFNALKLPFRDFSQVLIQSNGFSLDMKTMKQLIFMNFSISNTVLLLAAFTTVASCVKKQETIQPVEQNIVEAVYASGNIYPENEYKVAANADGYLRHILVVEGDTAGPGKPLFVIDSDVQDARYQAAARAVELAYKNLGENSPMLSELKNAIGIAELKFKNDSLNYARMKDLLAKNAISQVDFERQELGYSASQSEFSSRKAALQRTKDQLQVELKNAESQLAAVAKDRENSTVRALENCRIYDISKENGELVRRGELLAIVGNAREMVVKLAVDELDIVKIEIGQKVFIKADVYGDKVFEARISKVYPKLNREDQSFRVDAKFMGETPNDFYGLTIEANIVVSEKSKALTIPKTFLADKDSVLILQDGKPTKIAIETGIDAVETIEILSGLSLESTLVKP